MPDDNYFGRWLQVHLDRRRWKAADFARRLRVGNSTVTMWLRGERNPTPASCHQIADALDIDPREVLQAAGHLERLPMEHLDRWHAALDPLLKRIAYDEENVFNMRSEADRIIRVQEMRARKKAGQLGNDENS